MFVRFTYFLKCSYVRSLHMYVCTYVRRLNVVDNSTLCSFLARINELRSMHSSDVGHQVDKIRMQEQDWATREQEYRKRIQQLEAKVGGRWGYTIPAHAFQHRYTCITH